MKVLLTGGLGFIGSHTAVELIEQKHEVVIADNLANTTVEMLEKIEAITGVKPAFYELDVADKEGLRALFAKEQLDAVVHFAGLKAVGESVAKPLEYYRNNLDSTLTLLETMVEYKVKTIIFSSSATVYGMSDAVPFVENQPTGGCTNPYGWTKWMIEQIMQDTAKAFPELSIVLLRYFNPIGAHKSGLIGEKPNGIPNNLMPYITQVAVGKLKQLSVFGNDYPTPDGTGVRDYIHVVDLAKGHLAALNYGAAHHGVEVFNLGTGHGYSVLDLVNAFQKANNVPVPYVIAPRRPGDIATCYADASKAKQLLGWEAQLGIEEMCEDSWRWEQSCKK